MILAQPATPIICPAPHVPWWHLPVGIFAVLTGLAAAAMSIKEKGSWTWKSCWLVAIFLFTAAELRMIVWSDADARKEQDYAECELQKNFETIESENRTQFQQTTDRVGKVFDKTEEAADTATEAVRNITGGDSFMVFHMVAGNLGAVNVVGKYPIRSAHVSIADSYDIEEEVHSMREAPEAPLEVAISRALNLYTYVSIPQDLTLNLSNTFPLAPKIHNGDEVRYQVRFEALNGLSDETYIRKRLKSGLWVEAYQVVGDIGPRRRVVLLTWVDPGFPKGTDGKVQWYLPPLPVKPPKP